MGDYDIVAIEKRIQSTVFSRRLRIKEMFRDYDPRRSWRCTKQQFIRALDKAGIHITYGEACALADAYIDDKFADVHPPGTGVVTAYQTNNLGDEQMDEILAYVL